MKKKILFRGTGTAVVTPFSDGKIDYASLFTILEEQIAAGVEALILGGTTGEAATLNDRERYELYTRAIDRIDGRCRVLFGTGTNDTQKACAHTQIASALGCDGILVVTPYYNKGTSDGILRHYLRIAEVSAVPLMLYNVPSRTGVCLTLPELSRLAECENIVAIKEASDSAERLVALSEFGDALALYAGNDSQIYLSLALGGLGVISVASNLYPRAVVKITDLYFEGRHKESHKQQLALLPLIRALFAETNPSPVKYALSRRGLCREEVRLPLAPPTKKTRAAIIAAMDAFEKADEERNDHGA